MHLPRKHSRLLFFLLWSLWITSEYWMLGDLSYVRIHDTANSHIPLVLAATDSIRGMMGDLQNGWIAGIDRLSNFGWWNLFYLPFLFLPPWLAHGLVTFLQRFVAGYFTARLMEECMGARRETAFLAGAVYALAHTDLGEVCFMHQLNEPGFPLLLWFLCRIPLAPVGRFLAASVLLGLALGWAMTHLIGTFFLVPAAWMFAMVYRADVRSWKDALALTSGIALFFAVSLVRMVPELWALALNAGDTYRGKQFGLVGSAPDWPAFLAEYTGYLLRWWPFALLAIVWMVRASMRDRRNLAVLSLLVLGLVLGPLLGPLKFYVAPYIGFARGVDYTRFQMVSALAMTMAASMAVGFLPAWSLVVKAPSGREIRWWRLSQVACVGLLLVAFAWTLQLKESHINSVVKLKQNWRALYKHPDLGRYVGEANESGYRFATAGAYFNLHPGFWLPYGAELADGLSPAYSDRYYKYWTRVINPLIALDRQIKGFHTWGAYVYLHHPRSGPEHDAETIPFARWYNLDLLSLAGVKYLVSDKEIDDSRLNPQSLPVQEQRSTAWEGMSRNERISGYLHGLNPPRNLHVYANDSAKPRFFLVGGATAFESEEVMYDALGTASMEKLSRSVFVIRGEAPDDLPQDKASFAGTITGVEGRGDRYRVDVDVQAPSLLVCNNQYYRWWKWTLDGAPATMFPAYGTFMAIVIPPGTHRVDVRYEPPYAGLLSWISSRSTTTP